MRPRIQEPNFANGTQVMTSIWELILDMGKGVHFQSPSHSFIRNVHALGTSTLHPVINLFDYNFFMVLLLRCNIFSNCIANVNSHTQLLSNWIFFIYTSNSWNWVHYCKSNYWVVAKMKRICSQLPHLAIITYFALCLWRRYILFAAFVKLVIPHF